MSGSSPAGGDWNTAAFSVSPVISGTVEKSAARVPADAVAIRPVDNNNANNLFFM